MQGNNAAKDSTNIFVAKTSSYKQAAPSFSPKQAVDPMMMIDALGGGPTLLGGRKGEKITPHASQLSRKDLTVNG